MALYRKKPVVIEAIQWTGDNIREITIFIHNEEIGPIHIGEQYINADELVGIWTLEGLMIGNLNDWIIKGVQGEFYPCKPDIFEATYEEVNDG